MKRTKLYDIKDIEKDLGRLSDDDGEIRNNDTDEKDIAMIKQKIK